MATQSYNRSIRRSKPILYRNWFLLWGVAAELAERALSCGIHLPAPGKISTRRRAALVERILSKAGWSPSMLQLAEGMWRCAWLNAYLKFLLFKMCLWADGLVREASISAAKFQLILVVIRNADRWIRFPGDSWDGYLRCQARTILRRAWHREVDLN